MAVTTRDGVVLVGVLAEAQVVQALGLRGRAVRLPFALSPAPRAGRDAGGWPRRVAGTGLGLAVPAMTPALRRYAEAFGLAVQDGVLGLAEEARPGLDDAAIGDAADSAGAGGLPAAQDRKRPSAAAVPDDSADGAPTAYHRVQGPADSGPPDDGPGTTVPNSARITLSDPSDAAAEHRGPRCHPSATAADTGPIIPTPQPDPALVAAIARAILAHPADTPAATIACRLPQIGVAAASALRGAATRRPAAMLPAAPDTLRLIDREQPHAGFFAVDRLTLSHRRHDGGWTPPVTREVFVAGDAAVVLPWDRARDRVLVIDQFRAAMVLRDEPLPWMIEPIAGRIDAGETPVEAAIREAREEANLTLDPATLIEGPAHYPSPGAVAEYIYSFIAPCDLPDGSAGLGGLASEAEDIRAHLIPRAELTQMALRGDLPNGPLTLLALWLEVMAPRLGARQPAPAPAVQWADPCADRRRPILPSQGLHPRLTRRGVADRGAHR